MLNASIRTSVRFVSVAVLAAACSSAFAANQGTKGNTSSGDAVVNANVPGKVQISQLADVTFDFTLWNTGDLVAGTPACVWSNTGGYNVTVTATETSFVLKATGESDLPYSVSWTDSVATAGAAVSYNTALASQVTDASNKNCTAGKLAQLDITLAGADLEAAASAAYSGTIAITVAPE